MFRLNHLGRRFAAGFPRIRGDVPDTIMLEQFKTLFSPHTRGCSSIRGGSMKIFCVFPAYAGMFRFFDDVAHMPKSFPRIRGDVPSASQSPLGVTPFSPHTRGCSLSTHYRFISFNVFPAYAGMFRTLLFTDVMNQRFPRIRGDVPDSISSIMCQIVFSPHTRGCSQQKIFSDPRG